MVEAIIALTAALFGGAGLKIIEALVNRKKDRADFAAQLRDELRVDLASIREELQRVEERLERSRQMYYAVLHAYNLAKSAMIARGLANEIEEIDQTLKHAQKEDE